MCEMQLQVFLNEQAHVTGKRVFERVVSVNDACAIPFENLIKSMRFLYGQKAIINFKIL